MKTLKKYICLYFAYFKMQIMGLVEYKLDFFIGMLSFLFTQGTSLIFIVIIFNNINQINGWSLPQLLLIYAITTLARSIHLIFFDNLWLFGWKYIKTGMFDRFLIRPVNTFFQLVAERFNFQAIVQIAIGLIVLSYCSTSLGLMWGIKNILILIILLISSGLIFAGIHLLFMTLSFWIIDSDPLVDGVFSLTTFTQYPLSIYPKAIGILLTWVVPYAFTSVIPAGFFFEGDKFSYLSLLTPIVSLIVCVLAYSFWKFGITRYSSTGS